MAEVKPDVVNNAVDDDEDEENQEEELKQEVKDEFLLKACKVEEGLADLREGRLEPSAVGGQ